MTRLPGITGEQAEVAVVRDVGAFVQRLVGVGEAVTPRVELGQYLAALGCVAGQRQCGKKVQAYAGGLQGLLDLLVPSAGA